jgi:hypothetical protein
MQMGRGRGQGRGRGRGQSRGFEPGLQAGASRLQRLAAPSLGLRSALCACRTRSSTSSLQVMVPPNVTVRT